MGRGSRHKAVTQGIRAVVFPVGVDIFDFVLVVNEGRKGGNQVDAILTNEEVRSAFRVAEVVTSPAPTHEPVVVALVERVEASFDEVFSTGLAG